MESYNYITESESVQSSLSNGIITSVELCVAITVVIELKCCSDGFGEVILWFGLDTKVNGFIERCRATVDYKTDIREVNICLWKNDQKYIFSCKAIATC